MSLDLAAICEGFRVRLDTIPGLNALALIPGSITAPCAWPQPVSGEPPDAFDGIRLIQFKIVIAGGNIADLQNAQRATMRFLGDGASSIEAAIEDDETLGGTVDNCQCIGWGDYGLLEMGALQFVGVILNYKVDVSGIAS